MQPGSLNALCVQMCEKYQSCSKVAASSEITEVENGSKTLLRGWSTSVGLKMLLVPLSEREVSCRWRPAQGVSLLDSESCVYGIASLSPQSWLDGCKDDS
jgi:hypothetical protein